ncbi:hypothetical protein QJS10_CPA16g00375 [Acorus calamus]|uniref:Uncharacterized protein n=1 Tax=Acorus calamus TaxID=4465 RepID=A0AAV9D530_ACOCL|nr:hypothetical protein QJS10_CPA16g00375 [Acorus calamus]
MREGESKASQVSSTLKPDLTVRVEVCLPSAHKYVQSSEGDLRIPCRAWTFQEPGSESAVDVPRATREVCGYLGHRGQDGAVVQMSSRAEPKGGKLGQMGPPKAYFKYA